MTFLFESCNTLSVSHLYTHLFVYIDNQSINPSINHLHHRSDPGFASPIASAT